MADDMSFTPSRDEFAALLDESLAGRDLNEGSVVVGHVVGPGKGLPDRGTWASRPKAASR